jgi:hypothetical protein
LPSAVRGAGALRLGFPSGVRGVPASGSDSHCAATVPPVAQINATANIPLRHTAMLKIRI